MVDSYRLVPCVILDLSKIHNIFFFNENSSSLDIPGNYYPINMQKTFQKIKNISNI